MKAKDLQSKIGATVKKQDEANEVKFNNATSVIAALAAVTTASAVAVDKLPSKSLAKKDTFSLSHADHALIDELRNLAAREGHIANRSEIVRAGLRMLAMNGTPEMLKVVKQIEKLKPGSKKPS